MTVKLSSGSIDAIINQGQGDLTPVLQIINLKKITSPGAASDRYRLLVSDGDTTYSHVMLATQLNDMMETNQIDTYCVIKLNRYLCNTVQQEKRILILLDITVLKKGSEVKEKLGSSASVPQEAAPHPVKENPAPTSRPSQNLAPASRPPLNPARSFGGNTTNTTSPVSKTAEQTFGGRAVPAAPTTPTRIHKINTITPYQNRWRIRARVTQKSNVRTWSNSRGEGKLFSVTLLDDTADIKATAFKEDVDKFYDVLEVGKVYYVSRCTLKSANRQFNNTKSEYEMTFSRDTVVEKCEDDVDDLPTITFEFVSINEMEKHPANSIVDVIGVVKVCNDLSTVIGKQSQKEITKRDLQIVDQSGVAISLTLWGNDAISFDGSNHPVVAIRGARLSDFGGRSLSVLASSQLIINPNIREAQVLRGWYDLEGSSIDFSSFRRDGPSGGFDTNWKTFAQVVSENLGHGDKPDYFTTKATVMVLKKDNCMYTACPSENCNKKVVDQGNGMWRCEKCNREFPNHKWRMILQGNLADFSGQQWVTSFQESAEALLDIKADELGELRSNDEVKFDQVFQKCLFKEYIFKLRSKVEVYNEESRLKSAVVNVAPVDYVQYGKYLVGEIGKLGL